MSTAPRSRLHRGSVPGIRALPSGRAYSGRDPGDRGEACAPGEVGRVVVTPLRNFAMPLLRYDISDYAELGELCPCGRGLPVLRRVVGRARHMLVAPDGQRYWPFFGATSFRRIAPLTQYQFVQTSCDAIEGRLVVERPLTQAEQEALRAHTTALSFRIEFSFVAESRAARATSTKTSCRRSRPSRSILKPTGDDTDCLSRRAVACDNGCLRE